ncbi:MAG: hypothetical protein [Sanya fiers-like virus 39]|nr:MAG: hypothetical protein [Sanya fiers-like virus 39]
MHDLRCPLKRELLDLSNSLFSADMDGSIGLKACDPFFTSIAERLTESDLKRVLTRLRGISDIVSGKRGVSHGMPSQASPAQLVPPPAMEWEQLLPVELGSST